ncbi:MAG: acyltransferase [Oscillospiraceae bacterium]|jgi:membrane-bound acyltransferase YfiQ involved in biofilm formation|nr:acyltransferase [Oscillospiraceae bacterium]
MDTSRDKLDYGNAQPINGGSGRILSISLLELALCLLVICNHVAANTLSADADGPFAAAIWLLRSFVGFAMPGFVFASALKLGLSRHSGKSEGYLRFLVGRVRRVYLPYLLWVLIYYLYFVLRVRWLTFSWREMALYVLNGTLVAHFYFILVIMQFYVLFPLLRRAVMRVPAYIGLPAALAVTLAAAYFNQNSAVFSDALMWDSVFPTYLIYWMLGAYTAAYYTRVTEFAARHSRGITVIGIAAVAARAAFGVFLFKGGWTKTVELTNCLLRIALIAFLFALTRRVRLSEKRANRIFRLHETAFFVFFSHPLFLFEALRYISAARYLAARFAVLGFAGAAAPFGLGLLITYIKKRLKKRKKFVQL